MTLNLWYNTEFCTGDRENLATFDHIYEWLRPFPRWYLCTRDPSSLAAISRCHFVGSQCCCQSYSSNWGWREGPPQQMSPMYTWVTGIIRHGRTRRKLFFVVSEAGLCAPCFLLAVWSTVLQGSSTQPSPLLPCKVVRPSLCPSSDTLSTTGSEYLWCPPWTGLELAVSLYHLPFKIWRLSAISPGIHSSQMEGFEVKILLLNCQLYTSSPAWQNITLLQ